MLKKRRGLGLLFILIEKGTSISIQKYTKFFN